MLDRGAFWTASPLPGNERFAARGVEIRVVHGLSQVLVSGRLGGGAGPLAGLSAPVGFRGVATGPRYAAAVARDRALLVSTAPLDVSEGWDDEAAVAVTRIDDGFVVVDIAGDGLADLLAAATTLPPDVATRSASVVFAGLPCVAYRAGTPDVLRLHVERPLAAALAAWLRSV
ncbi:hypothetical protein NK718_03830 [Alsobacter sp. SYSU M60028]|uniref:Sarcosine oxidase subunit gamma n=1 Tax=Alsobacter ponti TaxID=2962936 RepID=A0ABT1L9A9_9HYPH|nr:hypothetical protein [Alsobacter ponti]MCP8937633.1 hypothetical protein [Alsobacter ponti]